MAEEQEWGYWFSPWHNGRPNSLIESPGTQDPGISFYKERRTGIEERMRRVIIEEGRKMGLSWELIEEAYYYFVKLHRLKTLQLSIDEGKETLQKRRHSCKKRKRKTG